MRIPDDDFRIRPGRIRDRGARSRPKSFVAQVLGAAQKAGYVGRRRGRPISGQPSRFGRGRAAAFTNARLLDPSRRVTVKARVVRHRGRKFRSATLSAHLAYLKRVGVTKDGEAARMFDSSSDTADEKAFAERCNGDRHHFRFIVSPEDAADLADLKGFTRDLVGEMERDLGTKLDWIGVDHWNTDNPHVHLLIRGRTDDGSDLVISRDYISRGIRARSEELVTLELGPKNEPEVRSALEREVEAERWTRLDAAIGREAADDTGVVDLRPPSAMARDPQVRRLMIGRLQRLERMGLARSAGPAQWVLESDAEPTLRALGLRGDIIKAMHRDLGRHGIERSVADYDIHEATDIPPILGRLVAKGLHDELTEEAYVVIDGVDGRAHHVRFADMTGIEHVPQPGGIVELRHMAGEAADRRSVLSARSDLAISAQVKATGATWLDYQLVARERATLASAGFGAEVREALEARIDHLTKQGLARRPGQRVIFASDLLNTLRRRELDDVTAQLALQTGLSHRPPTEGDSVSGTYSRRLNLASGRFAMIDDALGFSLVPWRPALERRIGQHVSGVVSAGGAIDWDFSRKRGLGI
jgi:type IV secretory pathway VirD2 relaxase